jgi:thiol-disulfide isomerase/thioredoxin
MRRIGLAILILLLALTVACGTAKGRYDGDELVVDDDAIGDDDAGDDDDDATQPDIEKFTWNCAGGQELNLYDLEGKVVLLTAGAFWCEPCKEEAPSLQEDLWETYGDQEFVIVSLIVETSDYTPATQATAEAWKDEFGLDFYVCADPDWSLRPYFIQDAIPFNLLLTPELTIELRTHEYDSDVLSLLIEDLL